MTKRYLFLVILMGLLLMGCGKLEENNETEVMESEQVGEAYLEVVDEVRSGENLEVYLVMNVPGSYAVMGNLKYETEQMELLSLSSVKENWLLTTAGDTFLLEEDDNFQSPLGERERVLKIVFKVNEKIKDSKISIELRNLSVTDGEKNMELSNMAFMFSVKQ